MNPTRSRRDAELDIAAMSRALRETLGIDPPAVRVAALLRRWRRELSSGGVVEGDRDRAGAESGGPVVPGLIGRSRAMASVAVKIGRVARSDATVLVLGENGTGKEIVARAVHDLSKRRTGPFVTQNCSAIAETLLESSLFGHVRGAFTGAVEDRRGLFEAAHGGTLFLDEIGDTSPALQARLLRVLEDGAVVPVGSTVPRRADARIVAATHRDLRALVRQGTFREDLFHRISVLTIEVPPLRDRLEDVALLVEHFLGRLGQRYGGRKHLADACLHRLAAHSWPGNVRELEHEVERLWILSADSTEIGEEHLSPEIFAAGDRVDDRVPGARGLHGEVEALERRRISEALQRTGGNRTRAAELLGVSRRNLIRKLARMDGGR